MNNLLWKCTLTTTQSYNSCGIPQPLPGHAVSRLKHTLYNREQADLCRRLLCQENDKPFQAQTQVDLQGLKTAGSRETKGFQEEENIQFKMLTGHLVTEKDCLPVPEVREV